MAAPTKIEWTALPALWNFTTSQYQVKLPNATALNDTILLLVTWGSTTATLSIADDASGGTNTYVQDKNVQGSGQTAVIARASSVKAGTRVITLTFSGAVQFDQAYGMVVNNLLASPVDVTCGQAVTSSPYQCGSMTTTSDGDFIVMGLFFNGSLPNAIVSWTAGAGFTQWGADGSSVQTAQYGIQTTHGAINPQMTSATTYTGITVGVAYKTGSTGGSPGTGVYVKQVANFDLTEPQTLAGTSFTVQFPCDPANNINQIALGYQIGNGSGQNVNSITDDQGGSYSLSLTADIGAGTATGFAFVAPPSTAACSPTRTVTINLAKNPNSSNPMTFAIWGLSGVGGIDGNFGGAGLIPCNSTGNFGASSGTLNSAPTGCTTAVASEVILVFENHNSETVTKSVNSLNSNLVLDLQPDLGGTYMSLDCTQDGGMGHYYQASPGAFSASWTVSNYEGGLNMGEWAASAIAFLPASPSALVSISCW